MNQNTSELGRKLIMHYESLNDGDLSQIGLQPKKDCSGIYTIGWGRALSKPDGTWIKTIADVIKYFPQYLTITVEQAEQYLEEDLKKFEDNINSLELTLEQNQFDALVSFAYNCGFNNLVKSTLLKRVKGIVKTPDIATCFGMWNKSAGIVYKGLTFRRQTESTLYNTGILTFYN
jgi:lysozyme